MQLPGFCDIRFESGIDHRAHQPRCFVGHYRHDAVAAEKNHSESHRIVSAKDAKVTGCTLDDLHDLREITGCLFDGNDISKFGQAKHGLSFDVPACSSGNVVDNHRKVLTLGDRLEMLVVTLLAGLVVV